MVWVKLFPPSIDLNSPLLEATNNSKLLLAFNFISLTE